jgi:hypothetical protein
VIFVPIIGIPLALITLLASMGLIFSGLVIPGVALLFAGIL